MTRARFNRWTVAAIAALALILLTACGGGNTSPSAAPAANVPLFIDVDTVRGGANLTEDDPSCVQMSLFAHNEEVVWRVKVTDPETGEDMDDTDLDTLQVILPDQTLDMAYGGHPHNDPVDFFWSVSWDIPEGYPSGIVSYSIKATDPDGRSGTWDQFGVASAQLTVSDEVRPVISE